MTSPKTVQTTNAFSKILKGVARLSDTVATTMGPAGRNVMYQTPRGPVITKDGVTVAEQLRWADPTEDMAAQVVIQAARKSADTTGDGTTTTTVLAYHILKRAGAMLAAGHGAWGVCDDLNDALEATLAMLDELKVEPTPESIIGVATISSNGDVDMGSAVGAALNHVGPSGIVRVVPSKTQGLHLSYGRGAWADRGSVSPYFLKEQSSVTLRNCYVLLSNSKVSNSVPLLSLLKELAPQANKKHGEGNWSFLVVGSTVEGDALHFMVQNLNLGKLNCAAIRAPGYGDNHVEHLWDLAAVVGAKVVGDEQGYRYKDGMTAEVLGFVEEAIVSKTLTQLIPSATNSAWEQRTIALTEEAESCTSMQEVQKYQDRLSRIGTGVATISVGATTEVEGRELHFRLEDALGAARAALRSGVIPGAGSALLRISKNLRAGGAAYRVLGESLMEPFLAIHRSEEDLHSLMAKYDSEGPRWVHDIRTKSSGDLLQVGVLDPLDVTKEALRNAVAAASLLIMTHCTLEPAV